jgi:drug/metabolite transporter (DMT)-like permease
VIAVVALLTYVPIYLMVVGPDRLLRASTSLLLVEGLVQGVGAGIGSLFLYAKTVQILGAARAAVFPALAPGIAALLAWPILGHLPTGYETLGLAVAIVGLLITATAGSGRISQTGPR